MGENAKLCPLEHDTTTSPKQIIERIEKSAESILFDK
jgi:hypothetical protein